MTTPAIDGRFQALPETVETFPRFARLEMPYPAAITKVVCGTKPQRVDIYFDITTGDFANVYDGIFKNQNKIQLWYNKPNNVHLSHKRLSVIAKINGIDADVLVDAFDKFINDGDKSGLNNMVGLNIFVDYHEKKDIEKPYVCTYQIIDVNDIKDSDFKGFETAKDKELKEAIRWINDNAPAEKPAEGLILYVDSRNVGDNHSVKHAMLSDYYGFSVHVKEMNIGDYNIANYPAPFIDTKASLQELSQNLDDTGNFDDLSRFTDEIQRAKDAGDSQLTFVTTMPGSWSNQAEMVEEIKKFVHPVCKNCGFDCNGSCLLKSGLAAYPNGDDIIKGMRKLCDKFKDTVQFVFVHSEKEAAEYIANTYLAAKAGVYRD